MHMTLLISSMTTPWSSSHATDLFMGYDDHLLLSKTGSSARLLPILHKKKGSEAKAIEILGYFKAHPCEMVACNFFIRTRVGMSRHY